MRLAESDMASRDTIGCIGVGVMGEPICSNLMRKSGWPVIAFDLAPEPLERLRAQGVHVAASVREVVAASETVFLCLPSGQHVRAVVEDADGILAAARAGQTVVDLGT